MNLVMEQVEAWMDGLAMQVIIGIVIVLAVYALNAHELPSEDD